MRALEGAQQQNRNRTTHRSGHEKDGTKVNRAALVLPITNAAIG